MKQEPPTQLQIGRAAFASVFSASWWLQRRKILLGCAAAFALSLFTLIQFSNILSSGISPGKTSNVKWTVMDDTSAGLPPHELAQRCLALGDVEQAVLQARSSIEKTEGLTSAYYSRFRKTSLLIAGDNYVQALQDAKQLKADLEKDDLFWSQKDPMVKSGSILYAYNLMRIATLEHEVGSRADELRAWEELVDNAGWEKKPSNLKTYDPEAYGLLAANFQKGEVSLRDFIEERRAALRDSNTDPKK